MMIRFYLDVVHQLLNTVHGYLLKIKYSLFSYFRISIGNIIKFLLHNFLSVHSWFSFFFFLIWNNFFLRYLSLPSSVSVSVSKYQYVKNSNVCINNTWINISNTLFEPVCAQFIIWIRSRKIHVTVMSSKHLLSSNRINMTHYLYIELPIDQTEVNIISIIIV